MEAGRPGDGGDQFREEPADFGDGQRMSPGSAACRRSFAAMAARIARGGA
jgi:hypothetical protein